MHCLKVPHWWDVRNPYLHLYFLGDIHSGAKACDVEQLDRDIKAIERDELAKVFLMGDLGDYIKRSDKRFDPRTVWPWLLEKTDIAREQGKWVAARLKPVADQGKIVGACEGNHENEICARYEHDLHAQVCEALEVPSLGYYGIVRLACRRKDHPRDSYAYDVAVHHGSGGGTTDGAVLTALNNMLAVYDVDVLAIGHRHKRLHVEPQTVSFVDGREPSMRERQRVGVCAGTYLKTFAPQVDTYSGKKAYRPVRTGCVKVRIRIPDHDLRVEF